jgi:hypothetical protein
LIDAPYIKMIIMLSCSTCINIMCHMDT